MKKLGTMLKPKHLASLVYKVGLLSLVLAVALQSTSITVLAATSPTFNTPGAANYSVLSGAAVTNTGPTTISGNVGISPGIGALPHYTGFASVTFGPGSAVHDADPSAAAAQADNTAAFTALDQPCTTTYAGTKDLAALNLVPGVYCADAFRLSGTLTLSGSGVWIFKSASDLITSSGVGASVVGGDPCNVWWRVVSSATLGVGTHFIGNILASTAITLQTNASLNGRAMTQTAAVTMDSNSISGPICAAPPPTFTTTASGPVSAGGTITDTAHLVGGAGVLGGNLTFNVFLPGDTTCAAPTAVGAPIPVTGIGDYTSATFTTGAVGTYRWQATYDDGVNPAVTTACNEAGESSEVNALFTPVLTSTASGPVTVGDNITDTAHFTGGSTVPPPTGTISFNVYLPGDTLCATPIAVGPARALTGAGVGDYTSAAYNTTVAGSFRWRAFYSGDANNNPASTACNAANETSIVNRATPTLTTTASTPVTVGANITDTATLGGGYGALSGTILFYVYAPGDPGCTTPIPVLPAKTVTGAGNYISGSYTTTIVGSYLWQAIYSGDLKNAPVTTPCNDAGETSVVNAVGGKGGGGGTTPSTLPGTGFEPGVVTRLPKQSVDQTYSRLGDLWLEIPRLGVQMPIVGVSPTEKSWDVTWLSDQAGWLQGTAFPTWSGNSVLTGHVYDANGNEGPFVHLDTLWYGDQIYIHAWGQLYIYEVRSRLTLSPNSVSTVIRHEDYPWVTLVTCQGYNEKTNSYLYRTVIKAVLMKIN